jgi:hypothetical protein
MDVTERVLRRLERIDELRARSAVSGPGGGSAGELLRELEALVAEAEAWARAEGDPRARAAAAKLRGKAEGMR